MDTLFTTAIASRFKVEFEVPAPKFGPKAVLGLIPATLTLLREVAHTFNLCRRCLGFGVISVGEGEFAKEQLCPKCKGGGETTMSDLEPRREVLARVLKWWKNVLAKDPVTGKLVELELTDVVRSGIPLTEGYDYILKLARDLVTAADEQGKAPSPAPPENDSDTGPFTSDGDQG